MRYRLNITKRLWQLAFFIGLISSKASAQTKIKTIPFSPQHYICYQTENPIVIDGIINDNEWAQTEWSNLFVDIEGDKMSKPKWATKVKMLWDNDYLYIAAELEEPHIWANLTKHDAVIFADNDFEVFIDVDGDTHNYYEFEMNALNTNWDLWLTKPYRDGGLIIDSWEILGLKSAVKIYGTLNNPSDVDQKWTLELAIPLKVLNEGVERERPPVDGTQWRINFSRVEWQTDVVDGKYIKKKDVNGRNLPEYNFVWSPQGVIDMHIPERWGYLQFSSQTKGAVFKTIVDEEIKLALRELYFKEKEYFKKHQVYTDNLESLNLDELQIKGKSFTPKLLIYPSGYVASFPSFTGKGVWYIQNDGKIWLDK